MITRFNAFAARNMYSLLILVAVLAMALGGIISWTHFGIFAAGWFTGLVISYLNLRTL